MGAGLSQEKLLKRYNRLKKFQSDGMKITLLEDEPSIGIYEIQIMKAIKGCDSIVDIKAYAELLYLPDALDFTEIVMQLKGEQDAKN